MRISLVSLVERISRGRIRGQHHFPPFQPSLRWWWTPWTARFGHNGWVFLSVGWFWRFRHGA